MIIILIKILNLFLKLFNKHKCNWNYSNLEHQRMFNPPDRDIYMKRKCKICKRKQRRALYLNQEGEVSYTEWIDVKQ